MTKGRKIKSFTALFAAICILLGTVFATGVRADDEEYYYPTLYCNDEVWYKEDIFPLDLYYQTYYVPASVFARFDGVTVTPNERFNTLLISYVTDTAKFISFNIQTDTALTDSTDEFYAMTYTKDGERYVPAETVCKALGFSFEYKNSSRFSITAMRICDGSQKKSFDELVSLYVRGEESTSTTDTTHDTTAPPIVEYPIPVDSKTLYITFDNFDKNVIDKLILTLKEHNVKATFFMKTYEFRDLGESLIKIVAAGHSVGLCFDTSGFEADCNVAFRTQNDILMRLVKYESRFVRICGENPWETEIKKAEENEYIVWGWDVSFGVDNAANTLSEFERAANEKDVLTIRFCGTEKCPEVLDEFLRYIEKMNFNTRTINNATGAEK